MLSTLLVGFGFSAQTFHLPFLQANAQTTIGGVVSSRPDAVAEHLPGVPVFASLDEALAQQQPDWCVITTPNTLHAEQARQCLQAGVDVLVEKPFTLSVSDAQALVEEAQQAGRRLQVFHNRRFDGDFLTIQKLLAEHQLGSVRRMVSRFDRFRPHPRNRWRENAGPGAGIFWDLGPHLVDQCVQLFGLPLSVQASIRALRDNSQSDDCFEVCLDYADKQVVLGSSPFQAGPTLRFDVQGTAGNYRKYNLDPQENQLRAGTSLDDPAWGKEPRTDYGCLFSADGAFEQPTERGDYRAFYRSLIDHCVAGTPSPCDARSVLPVMQIMAAARASADENKTIFLQNNPN